MRRKSQLPVSENVNRVLKEIARKMGGGQVRIGFLEGATYPDGTPVAAVAFWDEFGHGGRFPSPPRSFFRTMIAKESPGWGARMGELAKQYKFDGAQVLAKIGEEIADDLKDSIIATNEPPLSKTTLRLRYEFGNHPERIKIRDVLAAQATVAKNRKNMGMASGTQAKPLVWTGHLLDSVGFEVKG